MRNISIVFVLSLAICLSGCKDCPEPVLQPCDDLIPQPEYCGFTVATCYAPDGVEDVAVIFDTKLNSMAPVGDDWGQTITAIHPANWKVSQIGQVFGIAIDDEENIYLASSDVYYQVGFWPSGNIGRPFPAGQVFKCSPPSWTATPLFAVPNTAVMNNEPLNGTGNIAFDKMNKQLFVTNLEDGMIYQASTTGVVGATPYDPWAPDIAAPGIAGQNEQVWGIGINYENDDVKIYFPRVTSSKREIYSITLSNGDFPSPGSEVLEISNVPGTMRTITDLAFSSDGLEMLVAERGDPHHAKTISYTLTGTSWTFNKQYFVGSNAGADGENTAGGVDFSYTEQDGNPGAACDEYFWASGNFMIARNSSLNYLYGIQRISYSGNQSASAPTPTANQDTDLFIDFDGIGGTNFKGTIGDVEAFDCNDCVDPCRLNDFTN